MKNCRRMEPLKSPLWVSPLEGSFGGNFYLPGDKSISHRVLIMAALAEGTSKITGLPLVGTASGYRGAGDVISTLNVLQKLGVKMSYSQGQLTLQSGLGAAKVEAGLAEGGSGELEGQADTPCLELDCGNSGTCMRLMAGVLTAIGGDYLLLGDTSLSRRPMLRVVRPLQALGGQIEALGSNNTPPLRIAASPNLQASSWRSQQASAQVKSAFLLAASFCRGTSYFYEPGLSRDHTERLLSFLGADLLTGLEPPGRWVTLRGPFRPPAFTYDIPGDPSSAAFLVLLAVLHPHSQVVISNLNLNGGRLGFFHLLQRMGANIVIEVEKIVGGEPLGCIKAGYSKLKAIEVRESEVPQAIDELPLLALAATQAQGRTVLRGAKELRCKESDRISCVVSELRKLGANICELGDGFAVEGPTLLQFSLDSKPLESRGDHRLEMGLVVADLCSTRPDPFTSLGASAVSFPGFYKILGLQEPL